MQLAIVQNPYVKDPKELWQTLNSLDEKSLETDEFDAAGFEILRSKLSNNPRFIVKSK